MSRDENDLDFGWIILHFYPYHATLQFYNVLVGRFYLAERDVVIYINKGNFVQKAKDLDKEFYTLCLFERTNQADFIILMSSFWFL